MHILLNVQAPILTSMSDSDPHPLKFMYLSWHHNCHCIWVWLQFNLLQPMPQCPLKPFTKAYNSTFLFPLRTSTSVSKMPFTTKPG